MSSKDIFWVIKSTSAKIGIYPVFTIQAADEKKLLAGTIISEFFGNFKDFIATSNAAVPLQIATEYLFPINFEKFFSKIFPNEPVV